MDKPWKVIFAFVGVFIAGAVFGGFFTLRSAGKWGAGDRPRPVPKAAPVAGQAGKAAPPPGRIYPQVMRQFTQRLKPTPEQQKSIEPIVSRAAEDLQRMQREHLTDTTRTTERMYADVASILTPVQRTKLEQMREEMHERVRKEKEKRGEAPPAADVMAKPGARPGATPRPEKAAKTVPGGTP